MEHSSSLTTILRGNYCGVHNMYRVLLESHEKKGRGADNMGWSTVVSLVSCRHLMAYAALSSSWSDELFNSFAAIQKIFFSGHPVKERP